MKKNLKKLLFVCFVLLVTSVFFITLSSKAEFVDNVIPCQELQPLNGKIQINFPITANSFRNPNYEYYIPFPDLRNGNEPGQWRHESNKYFCLVTVTSPNCSQWSWEKAMDLNNSNGSGRMDIKVAPQGYSSTIKVEYWERGDDLGGSNSIDFNKPPFETWANASRVKYQYQQTFQGWGSSSVAQPINLTAVQNAGYYAINDSITVGGKTASGDLSGLNDYINMNK